MNQVAIIPEVRPSRIRRHLDFLQNLKNLVRKKAEAVKHNRLVLTPEEIANGWTAETLKSYFEGREKAQAGVILYDPRYRTRARPRFSNNLYRPLRWRGP